MQITKPPHPPTANAGGTYIACTNETFNLDGSKSFSVDASYGVIITVWDWELKFIQPLQFNDLHGVKPATSFATAGTQNIGLRVTDNSDSIFHAGNLTGTDFTTAAIWDCGCFATYERGQSQTRLA